MLLTKKRKNYKGNKCNKCFIDITIGSKSGFCRKCRLKPKHTEETKKKISKLRTGKNNPMYGKKPTIEHRKKISDALKGEKSPHWKGGLSNENKKIRDSIEYRLWREAVFKRDNYTCIWCNIRGGKLNADHIKPFALFPELRFAIDNGRTLCVKCHRTTETYGGKSKRICN